MSFSLSLFANPWTAARQASLSITNPWSLLKLKAIELVMPSNRFIFCHPLLFLPSIFPRIRVFSNKSVSRIRIIGAMKIKTTMRYHYISNRMDKRNKTNHTKCWWICRTIRILMWTEWGGQDYKQIRGYFWGWWTWSLSWAWWWPHSGIHISKLIKLHVLTMCRLLYINYTQ